MKITTLRPELDRTLAVELVALQRASYAVEAELIGSTALPGLRDTPGALVAAALTWSGTRDGRGLLGAVAVEDGPGELGIHRLVVAPHAFRRGVGTALVRHVLSRAAGRPVTVSTGRANAPARTLYDRLGFVTTGESEVEPGLWVTHHVATTAGEPGPA